jgi:hypothetical protein
LGLSTVLTQSARLQTSACGIFRSSFVEELCSSSGLTDGLLLEIGRVIFEANPDEERNGALDFEEQQATQDRLARERGAKAVSQISHRMSPELEKEKLDATRVR